MWKKIKILAVIIVSLLAALASLTTILDHLKIELFSFATETESAFSLPPKNPEPKKQPQYVNIKLQIGESYSSKNNLFHFLLTKNPSFNLLRLSVSLSSGHSESINIKTGLKQEILLDNRKMTINVLESSPSQSYAIFNYSLGKL